MDSYGRVDGYGCEHLQGARVSILAIVIICGGLVEARHL